MLSKNGYGGDDEASERSKDQLEQRQLQVANLGASNVGTIDGSLLKGTQSQSPQGGPARDKARAAHMAASEEDLDQAKAGQAQAPLAQATPMNAEPVPATSPPASPPPPDVQSAHGRTDSPIQNAYSQDSKAEVAGYGKAKKQEPNSSSGQWSRAQSLSASGDHAGAAAIYRQIYEADSQGPDAAHALAMKGQEEQLNGQTAQAELTFELLARQFPQSPWNSQALASRRARSETQLPAASKAAAAPAAPAQAAPAATDRQMEDAAH
jgi:hypothetical protein